MKKINYFLSPILAVCLLTSTGCLGSFALSGKAINLVKSIDNSGIVSHVVFWLTLPISGTIFTIDIFVLNFLEFWTGSNPLAMEEGESETQIVMMDGVEMKVTASKNRMTIEPINSSFDNLIEVEFEPSTNSATVHSKNGSQIIKLK